MVISPLYHFPNPHFWQKFFDNIASMKIRNQHKNKCMSESCFFMFRRLQNNIKCFSISNTFIYIKKAEIWFEIITISGIKRSIKKNKYCKWKTCWVKNIIATKSIHHSINKNGEVHTMLSFKLWFSFFWSWSYLYKAMTKYHHSLSSTAIILFNLLMPGGNKKVKILKQNLNR